jgi:hypothetical protein
VAATTTGVHVGGGERFHDLPEKDQHSHVVAALGYALFGGGEGKPLPKPGYRKWKYAEGSPHAAEN